MEAIPDEDTVVIPKEVIKEAEAACYSLLPDKSKDSYVKEFNRFEKWRRDRHVSGVNEEILLAYFFNYRKKLAPSSMWTRYLMLRSTLKVYKKVDISKYGKLISYLKMEGRNYHPKKAHILEREHIEKFLSEAPDGQYLMMKIVLLLGISGGCRCDEITKLTVDNIMDKGKYLYVSIPDTKTHVSRNFTIIEEGFSINVLNLYRKYVSLRPQNISHRRFFLNYKNEKCTIQPVGINTISKIPQMVASFLNLPEPHLYTGHSLRRSSATLLANAGADITMVKRHGSWKSTTVAEGYIQDSISSKIDIAKKIQGERKQEENSSLQSTSALNFVDVEMRNTQVEPCTSVQDSSDAPYNITITSNNSNKPNKKTIALSFNINVHVN